MRGLLLVEAEGFFLGCGELGGQESFSGLVVLHGFGDFADAFVEAHAGEADAGGEMGGGYAVVGCVAENVGQDALGDT